MSEGLGLSDAHRYLTAAGRQQARDLAALLVDSGLEVGAMVTSPLVRAVQTAELLATGLEFRGPVVAMPKMAPVAVSDDTVELLISAADQLPPSQVVLAIGHEPSVSVMAGRLAGSERVPSFSTAEACYIDDGAIRWRLSPP